MNLQFKLTSKDFSFVNNDEKRVVEKGEFELMVGGSSKDKDLQKISFVVEENIYLSRVD